MERPFFLPLPFSWVTHPRDHRLVHSLLHRFPTQVSYSSTASSFASRKMLPSNDGLAHVTLGRIPPQRSPGRSFASGFSSASLAGYAACGTTQTLPWAAIESQIEVYSACDMLYLRKQLVATRIKTYQLCSLYRIVECAFGPRSRESRVFRPKAFSLSLASFSSFGHGKGWHGMAWDGMGWHGDAMDEVRDMECLFLPCHPSAVCILLRAYTIITSV